MSDWIRVEDRLPEYNEKVLVHKPDWIDEPVTILIRLGNDSEGDFYIEPDQIDDFPFKYRDIKHWMPLPKPPEPKP